MEKHEFMSPGWIAMARAQITRALAAADLRGLDFTLCEEFTDPPAHLRPEGAATIGFCVRIAGGAVEVGDRPRDDVDLRLVSDYAEARAIARTTGARAADPAVVQQRISAGKLRVIGDPAAAPPALAAVDLHELLAPRTA
jgi:hypothetical protein